MNQDQVPFALAFDRCQAKVDYRFFSPFWKLEETLMFWKKWEMQRDIETIRSFANGIIQTRRNEPEEQRAARNDLLSYFMRLTSEDGKSLSEKTLTDYVLNFIIAGRDTTAQLLSWAVQ